MGSRPLRASARRLRKESTLGEGFGPAGCQIDFAARGCSPRRLADAVEGSRTLGVELISYDEILEAVAQRLSLDFSLSGPPTRPLGRQPAVRSAIISEIAGR